MTEKMAEKMTEKTQISVRLKKTLKSQISAHPCTLRRCLCKASKREAVDILRRAQQLGGWEGSRHIVHGHRPSHPHNADQVGF